MNEFLGKESYSHFYGFAMLMATMIDYLNIWCKILYIDHYGLPLNGLNVYIFVFEVFLER